MKVRLPTPALLALLLLVASGVAVVAVYQATPLAWTVDVGGPLAGPLIVSGFYADEVAAGERYRWTQGHAEMQFTDIGADTPVVVRFRVGDRPPTAPVPLVFTITVNSQIVATYTQSLTATVYSTTVITHASGDPSVRLDFDAPTFRAPGDARDLGLKLVAVRVEAAPGAPPPSPPLAVLLWVAILTLAVYLILWRLLHRPFVATGAAVVVLAALAAGLVVARPLLTPWLLPLAAIGGVLGLAALGRPILRQWPTWLDNLADPRGVVAPLLLAFVLVGYAAFALAVLPGVTWIGHADYADNAVVARNLVNGRGFVVDYVAQFYRYYPGITHPADTWPLLQPLLIAPAFWLFGTATWIAKLPNLVLLLALAVAVYAFAGRWWDRRVGLLGAVLTLVHPYLVQTVLYPINDLSFTLLAVLTIGWAVMALDDGQSLVASHQSSVDESRSATGASDKGSGTEDRNPTHHATHNTQRTTRNTQHATRNTRYAILAGLAGGLLVWSKGTSGGLVLVGLVVGLVGGAVATRWAGRRPPRNWRPMVWMAGAAILVLLPLLIRNLLTFGAPLYSTEQYDAWILRFYTGGTGLPWEHIYADYLDGLPLPDRSLLLRSYTALYEAVAWGFRTLWNGGVLNGDILDLPVVVAGAAGWLLAPLRLRRLRWAWISAFLIYGLFVLLAWHYEPRYFLAVVPWFYIGTAALLFWIWDRLRTPSPEDSDPAPTDRARLSFPRIIQNSKLKTQNSAALLLPLAVAALLWPSLDAIRQRAASDSGPDSFATAGEWAATHLPPDAVVMTRDPWEFNWYARRPAVMIPEGSLGDVQAIVARYHVSYLWVGGASDSAKLRPQIQPLYRGQPLAGFPTQQVYAADGIYIYRLGSEPVK